MKTVKRVLEGLELKFHPGERQVLAQLVEVLIDLVSVLLPAEGDEQQLIFGSQVTQADLIDRDPALARLFPSAYADEEADLEFRRFTESDAALIRVEAATRVSDKLFDGDRVIIAPAELGDWVKTLTAIRLALTERNDPDLEDLVDWLGWLLESLLTA